MVEMEKYCPKCHKIHGNMGDKFCSNCGTKLKSREKRKPIPPELRHQILVRDGYRCRECGKSNKETSLEIDHIQPLSKGGSTTEENLWVLCRECNQAKKADVWKNDDIENTRNAISNLEDQLQKAEEDLEFATTEEEIFALKAKIKRFKKKEIPEEEVKLKKLIKEEKKINGEIKAQQQENKRRENLFNKLYVQLEDELLLEVCNHFSLNESTDEDNIKLLIDKNDEQVIYGAIASIKQELKEEANRKALYDKLNNTLSSDDINLFANEFSIRGSEHNVLTYLVFNLHEDEIDSLRVKLVEKEEKRLVEEAKNKLKNYLINSLTPNELSLFSKEFNLSSDKLKIVNYVVDNYSEEEIESLRVKLIKKEQKRIEEELLKSLTPEELSLFSKEFNLSSDNLKIVNYLADNYSEEEIESLRVKLIKKEQKRIEEEKLKNKILKSLTPEELSFFSKEFNLSSDNLKIVNYLVDNYSEEEIESLKAKLIKKYLIMELNLSLDIKQLIFLCKHFSLKQCTKDSLITHLENCSADTIKDAITLMKKSN